MEKRGGGFAFLYIEIKAVEIAVLIRSPKENPQDIQLDATLTCLSRDKHANAEYEPQITTQDREK